LAEYTNLFSQILQKNQDLAGYDIVISQILIFYELLQTEFINQILHP
jgi:hypothetical protein